MTQNLRSRLVTTALVLVAFCLLGTTLAVGLSSAVGAPEPDHSPPPQGLDEPPPLPEIGDEVAILGLGGSPLLDLDGNPLELPLEASRPDEPGPDSGPAASSEAATSGEPGPAVAGPPAEDVEIVPLLDAHVRTLAQAAAAQHYGPAETVRLFLTNGMVTSTDPAGQGITMFVDLLELAAGRHASGDRQGACEAVQRTRAGSDGVAPDLIGGLGTAALHATVIELGGDLGC